MSTQPLAGMVALVTGGAGGIGGAVARWLVRDGASVTIMGRTESTLREAHGDLLKQVTGGATVRYHVGDARNADDLQKAIEVAAKPTGSLNICVPTVGGGTIKPLLMHDAQSFLEDLDLNIVSSFLAIRYAAPLIADAGGGSIVCISSDAAKLAYPYLSGYVAAKAGLEALVRVAAEELGHLKVRVNAVRPGLTATRGTTSIFENKEIIEAYLREKPLGRTCVPDDIASAVRYLAGTESSLVTGQSFAVDGGGELRRAPNLEAFARAIHGDEAIDAALSGHPL